MEFRGHVKSSFIDYPDRICTVYFVGGCNLRCPYCHNSHLLRNEGPVIGEEEVFEYLEKRKKMLDGVCISGGEPTLHEGLAEFAGRIKEMGFLFKLDTNGTNPIVIEEMLDKGVVDYIAMDIKAPLGKYINITRVPVEAGVIEKSISLIRGSGVEHEFRTTVCRELLTVEDVEKIACLIKGCKKYVIQNFRDSNTVLAGEKKLTPFRPEEIKIVEGRLEGCFEQLVIR
ncbi:MAG: Ribonucleotide reductase of class III (anaerobic), activating protein [Firmicutes bacterium]|nr:Ribonucleotide reductase of class III (anaerobic), activating protein [Bacillota bacterium]